MPVYWLLKQFFGLSFFNKTPCHALTAAGNFFGNFSGYMAGPVGGVGWHEKARLVGTSQAIGWY